MCRVEQENTSLATPLGVGLILGEPKGGSAHQGVWLCTCKLEAAILSSADSRTCNPTMALSPPTPLQVPLRLRYLDPLTLPPHLQLDTKQGRALGGGRHGLWLASFWVAAWLALLYYK